MKLQFIQDKNQQIKRKTIRCHLKIIFGKECNSIEEKN